MCHSKLSAAESRDIFLPIFHVIKCALLSEVLKYVLAYPRSFWAMFDII